MSNDHASHRRILKTTAVSGGATGASIVIGVVKMKVFAVLLGPAGIGLFGIYSTIMALGAVVAGFGIGSSGVRFLAAVADDSEQAARARWVIWSATWPLAAAGGILVWLLREPISQVMVGSDSIAAEIGWLGLGVAVTVISSTQLVMLQGYRRIGDLAKVRLYGALLGAIAGVVLVWFYGEDAIVASLLAVPLATAVAALPFNRKLPKLPLEAFPRDRLVASWRPLLNLGFIVMVTGIFAALAQMAVRALIVDRLGLDAAGLYQAAWSISATSVGLILASMAADYFPRLSALAADPAETNTYVNQQIHVGLLLSAPLMTLLVATAPQVLYIAYSSDFMDASQLLRWAIAGDMLRLSGWALAYVLVTRSAIGAYFLVEISVVSVFVPLTWLLIPIIGLEAAGLAYFLSFAVYLAFAAVFCASKFDVRISASNLRLLLLQAVVLVLLTLLSHWSQFAALVAGCAAAAIFGVLSIRRLRKLTLEPDSPGVLRRLQDALRPDRTI